LGTNRESGRFDPGLRLVADEIEELPEVGVWLTADARRPGERREVVDLPEEFARALEPVASEGGLSLDVASALVVEAQWLTRRMACHATIKPINLLDGAAEGQSGVHQPLSSAEADYLRALLMSRTRTRADCPSGRVAIPVRLLGRIEPGLCYDSDIGLERAIRWETAALMGRLTMSEWALDAALGAPNGQRE
jgi:hypothetical protein